MTQPILVINPNSTEAVTEGIHRALDPLHMKDGPLIECLTLAEGPPGIETRAGVDAFVEPLLKANRAREDSAIGTSPTRSSSAARACPATAPGPRAPSSGPSSIPPRRR